MLGLFERSRVRIRGWERLRAAARSFLPECARILADEFGARRVLAFGSVVRGRFHERSDLDIGVEGVPRSRYLEARSRLFALAPVPVDLVRMEDAPDSLRTRILEEAEVLHDVEPAQ